jgi:DNA-binding Lrp family transcriptional regulator
MTNIVLCQHKSFKYRLESPTPMYEIISNPDLHIKQYYSHGKKQIELQVLDLLIWFHLKGDKRYLDSVNQYNKGVYPSQSFIAKRVGVTREWVNKLLKRLERMGYISSYYRNFNTKLYKVSFWFFLQDNLKFLSGIFPALRKAWLASYKHLSFTQVNSFLLFISYGMEWYGIVKKEDGMEGENKPSKTTQFDHSSNLTKKFHTSSLSVLENGHSNESKPYKNLNLKDSI